MVQQHAGGRGQEAQVKGLALVMESNAQSIMGVYEHLLETNPSAGDGVLDRLQAAQQICRELADEINRI